MTEANLLTDFARYQAMIRAAMETAAPFEAAAESATAVQIERGTIFAAMLNNSATDAGPWVDRLIELARSQRLARVAVVDRTGHHRPVYRALMIYAWLQAFSLAYESLPRSEFGRWEEALRGWADLLEAELGDIGWDETSAWAARGASAAEAAWTALALHVAGKLFIRDAWTDLASDFFGKLSRAQRPSGAFLEALASDNPETYWYHELVILHAAGSYAVQAEDRHIAAAVKRNTEFHLAETQPDHATTQPFGLFAFIWNAGTRSLADQLLHAGQTQHPGGSDGVSLILLADAVHCLGLFEAGH
jgi:hypothetical protein